MFGDMIPNPCPDCGRNMTKGEPHTADCLSAALQDAQDGDNEALAMIGAEVQGMLARVRDKPAEYAILTNIINRGGWCAAFAYAHGDKRFE